MKRRVLQKSVKGKAKAEKRGVKIRQERGRIEVM